ncbi:hypothetical protein Syun_026244 [Stephania yunnanensis]|uniref:Glutathione hydrolase n=1 Tax=Stephania yunnanensis TaxID=152371 RepID=A0AAP0ETL5_9MAGN
MMEVTSAPALPNSSKGLSQSEVFVGLMGQRQGHGNPLLGYTETQSWRRAFPVWASLALLLLACSILGQWGVQLEHKPSEDQGVESNNVVESEHGVVAADDGRCSDIGVSVLRDGGNAIDATVATALCLGVVNPMSSGIGGGGFMVFRSSSSSKAEAYDMRETAPLSASKDMYANDSKSKYHGALSLGVPGEIAGLYEAWLRHGRLSWKTLFAPAIRLAKDGFIVAPYLSSAINSSAKIIMDDPGLRQVFAPNGKFLKVGDTCYNIELARTLEAIAEQGAGVFYNGSVGENFVKDVRRAGGILTMEDLRNYKVDVIDAMAVDVMGYTILGMPPPSSGTLGISLVLNILKSYGESKEATGSLGLHRLIEAVKHMLAIRMNLGDPSFVNITAYATDMLSPAFAKQLQKKISDNTTFPPDYYLASWSQLRDHGTSHFCIVDSERNAVSMTTTVNDHFGAGVLSPSTGIVLNNEMSDFSLPTEISVDDLPPAPANFIEPNKRPLSSMTPVIILKDLNIVEYPFTMWKAFLSKTSRVIWFAKVTDGLETCDVQDNQLAGVIGGSGGIRITPAVIQVFLNHFISGMKPLAAVQHPRVYPLLTPNVVTYENWTLSDGNHIELSEEDKLFLQERGHELMGKPRGAICQFIVQILTNSSKEGGDSVFHGKLTAVSDPRKNGRPAAL